MTQIGFKNFLCESKGCFICNVDTMGIYNDETVWRETIYCPILPIRDDSLDSDDI